MADYRWFPLAVRLLGVVLIGFGLPQVFNTLTHVASEVAEGAWIGPGVPITNYAYELLYVFGGFVQCVFGVYLALGGRWLVAGALRSVYQTCAACGHEIGRPTPVVCQECGLPLPGAGTAANRQAPNDP